MTTETRTFEILLAKRGHVEAALVNLAKRAKRKGLPVLAWTWGEPYERIENAPMTAEQMEVMAATHAPTPTRKVARIPLTIPMEIPKFNGWTLLAVLEHLDGENIIRAVPGQVCPTEYRTRGPACDHCKHKRRRNDTILVRHDDGRTLQVGSTCLGDFLGTDTAGNLAARAEFLASIEEMSEEWGSDCGAAPSHLLLSHFLAFVAYSVRTEGWLSKTAAKERGSDTSTCGRACAHHWDVTARKGEMKNIFPTDEDEALGEAAAAWAEAISDDEVNRASGDYLHNVRAVARNASVGNRQLGIAASIIVAYQNHLGRELKRRARAERPQLDAHVGTVGKREVFAVELDFVTSYETDYGCTTVLKFRTPEGATLVWKASNTDLTRSDVGKRYLLKGTVKKHDDYKGEKQTLVTRCVEVEALEETKAA